MFCIWWQAFANMIEINKDEKAAADVFCADFEDAAEANLVAANNKIQTLQKQNANLKQNAKYSPECQDTADSFWSDGWATRRNQWCNFCENHFNWKKNLRGNEFRCRQTHDEYTCWCKRDYLRKKNKGGGGKSKGGASSSSSKGGGHTPKGGYGGGGKNRGGGKGGGKGRPATPKAGGKKGNKGKGKKKGVRRY